MRKNIGTIDKIIRYIIAIGLYLYYFMSEVSGNLAMFILIMATYIVTTCVISFSPFYVPFGISTLKEED